MLKIVININNKICYNAIERPNSMKIGFQLINCNSSNLTVYRYDVKFTNIIVKYAMPIICKKQLVISQNHARL